MFKKTRLGFFLLIGVALSCVSVTSQAAEVGSIPGNFNISSGATTYSLPIAVSPGRGGMQPDITLNYSSELGNSMLGKGWGIGGVSAIHRCASTIAQDGFVRGINFDANDRYCLDGRRLVPVSGVNGAVGAEYRLEIDNFSQIKSVGGNANNPASWIVKTKSGQVMTYGNTNSSVFKTSSGYHSWHLAKLDDTTGRNAVNYTYSNNGNTLYLSNITYVGGRVEFVYGSRSDTISSRVDGIKVDLNQRLTNIRVHNHLKLLKTYNLAYASTGEAQTSHLTSVTQCDFNNKCLKSIKFDWNPEALSVSNSWLGRKAGSVGYGWAHWPMDVDGDGDTDLVYEVEGTKRFYYLESQADGSFVNRYWFYSSVVPTGDGALFPMDVNGDGRQDLVFNRRSSLEYYAYINNANGTVTTRLLGSRTTRGATSEGFGHWVIDINSDGRQDLIYGSSPRQCYGSWGCWDVPGQAVYKALVTQANGTFVEQEWGASPFATLKDVNRWVTDVNGDGLSDLLYNSKDSREFRVMMNNGDGTATDQVWASRTLDPHWGWDKHWLMDVNSDGLDDIVYRSNGSAYYRVLENNGSGAEDRYWTNAIYQAGYNGSHWVMDANGDGHDDLVYNQHGSHNYRVIYTRGNLFPVNKSWGTRGNHGVGYNGTHFVFDQDGDGLSEIVYNRHNSDDYISLNPERSQPVAISGITDGQDNVTNIEYKLLTDSSIYTKSANSTFPRFSEQPPKYVASKVTAPDGIGGSVSTEYRYQGLLTDLEGRGSLGYHKIFETYPDTGKSIETVSAQSFPHTGTVIERIERFSGHMVSRSLSKMRNVVRYSKVNYPQIYQTSDYSYELGRTDYIKRVVTDFSNVDQYGNTGRVQVVSTANGESYTTITDSVYTNDVGRWYLGRLLNTRVRHISPNRPEEVKRTEFTYDTNTGLLKTQTITNASDTKSLATTTYNYDIYGQKTSVVDVASGLPSRTTTTTYDSLGRATRACNTYGECETYAFNNEGMLASKTDLNNVTTSLSYDGFGRMLKEARADGTSTTKRTYFTSSGSCGSLASHAYTCVVTTASGSSPVIEQFDSLGRSIRTIKVGFDGRNVYSDTEYNHLGEMARISREYFAGENVYWAESEYDALGRVIRMTEPGPHGSTTEILTEFDGLSTSVRYGPDALAKTTRVNALGQKVLIEEEEGAYTRFSYNADGNLLTSEVADDPTTRITLSYDEFGRKTSMDDPSMGRWTYFYNDFGELVRQVDAKNQAVTMVYDRLGRMISRTEPEGTSTWAYGTNSAPRGSRGKLLTESGPGITKNYAYDILGRPTTVTTRIGSESFTTRTSYDNLGRVSRTTYPGSDNFYVENVYNSRGYLELVRGLRSQAENHNYAALQPLISQALSLADEYLAEAEDLRSWGVYYKEHTDLLATDRQIYSYYGYTWATGTDLSADTALRAHEAALAAKVAEGNRLDNDFMNHLNHTKEELALIQRLINGQISGYQNKAENLVLLAEQTLAAADHSFEIQRTLVGAADAYGDMIADNSYVRYWRAVDVDASGRISAEVYGNGIVNDYAYNDGNGQLQSIHSSLAAFEPIRHLEYQYDAYQNVTLRDDLVNEIREEYSYDRLDRLEQTNVSSARFAGSAFNHVQTQHYDVLGNITYKSDVGSYYYQSGSPNAVTRAGNRTYSYDANGNMVSGDGRSIQWSSFNKPTRITKDGRSVNFSYGPGRARYKKVNHSGDTTLYVGGLYERMNKTNGRVDQKHYIYANGQLVAEHIVSNRDGRLTRYLHRDALGSVDLVTDSYANVVDRRSFDAWGKMRDLPWKPDASLLDPLYITQLPFTNKGYTGHEHIQEVGLIHMNGRVYDATLGRFLSADPFIQAGSMSQNYSRYTYVMNNPLKYNDPSGHFFKKLFKSIKRFIRYTINPWKTIIKPALVKIASIPILNMIVQAAACSTGVGCVAYAILSSYAVSGDFGMALQAGLITAATMVASSYIKTIGSSGTMGAIQENVTKAVAHGAVGGTMSVAQGGKFGQGFASSFFTKLVSPGIAKLNGGGSSPNAFQKFTGAISAALVGGTASKLGGGKFANGAKTAMIQYLYNQVGRSEESGQSGSGSDECSGALRCDEDYETAVNTAKTVSLTVWDEIISQFTRGPKPAGAALTIVAEGASPTRDSGTIFAAFASWPIAVGMSALRAGPVISMGVSGATSSPIANFYNNYLTPPMRTEDYYRGRANDSQR